MARRQTLAFYACAFCWCVCSGFSARAADQAVTPEQIRQILEENKNLQEQLKRQQSLIESLSTKVNRLEQNSGGISAENEPSTAKALTDSFFGKVSIGAEGGIAFFNTGSEGVFPNAEFRLDELKLFLEAPVWNQVYFFTELNLAERERDDLALLVGECYLDFENISELWNRQRMLNLRIGRMDIPFGEEYLTRDAIDNPLISHSLPDFWGVDEGIELYGRIGPVRYAVALQNGGLPDARDFNADKSVAGRIEYDPTRWLHLSVSGMRTGDLDPEDDQLSAMWFGNGFFRSLGSTVTTRFHANLFEGDVAIRFPHGRLSAFGGYIHYDDNDSAANNRRDVYYYSVEGVHDVIGKLYAGARFSQILAPNGFPITGNGRMGPYFFNPFGLTENIWRLSLGLGYRFSPNLLLKAEYSFEKGRLESGEKREHADLVAVEAAFKF